MIALVRVLCCNPNVTTHAIKALKDDHPDVAPVRNVAGMMPLMMLSKCKGQVCDEIYLDSEVLSLVRLLESLEWIVMC